MKITARGAATAAMVVAITAGTQPISSQTPPAEDTAAISIALVTIGQGDQYWTRFGHNALWIRDRERGTDIAYNWGLFDFNEPGFLQRFLSADTRYWMAGFDAQQMFDVYRSENRTLDVQELALTPAQARALRDFVEWNALPENREYRYDYYRDNCSTRVRDALDSVLGGAVRAATDTARTSHSYRWHTRRLLAGHGLTYAGIQLVLGQPADQPMTKWEEMFVPMLLRDHIRSVRVTDERGTITPLVQREWRMFQASRPAEADRPPNRLPWFGAIGLGFGALITALTATARRNRIAGPAAVSIASAWSFLAGMAGTFALGMWMFTPHVFWYQNENVLQFTPLSLALAVLIPLGARERASERVRRAASTVSLAVLALSVAGLLLRALPIFSQVNGEIIALALPLHAATAYLVAQLRTKPALQRT